MAGQRRIHLPGIGWRIDPVGAEGGGDKRDLSRLAGEDAPPDLDVNGVVAEVESDAEPKVFASLAARSIRCASDTASAMGFSTRTCFPASIAANVCWKWSAFGVEI